MSSASALHSAAVPFSRAPQGTLLFHSSQIYLMGEHVSSAECHMPMLDRGGFRRVKESRIDHASRRKHPGPHADETTVKSRYPVPYFLPLPTEFCVSEVPYHRIASKPTLLIPFLD